MIIPLTECPKNVINQHLSKYIKKQGSNTNNAISENSIPPSIRRKLSPFNLPNTIEGHDKKEKNRTATTIITTKTIAKVRGNTLISSPVESNNSDDDSEDDMLFITQYQQRKRLKSTTTTTTTNFLAIENTNNQTHNNSNSNSTPYTLSPDVPMLSSQSSTQTPSPSPSSKVPLDKETSSTIQVRNATLISGFYIQRIHMTLWYLFIIGESIRWQTGRTNRRRRRR